MVNMIQLNYYMNGEEVRPKYSKDYNNAHHVIKLDCLQDAIYYLKEEYKKVYKESKDATEK